MNHHHHYLFYYFLSILLDKKIKKELIKKLCKNLCNQIKKKYRGVRLRIKGIGQYSCNNCNMHLPIETLDKLYYEDNDVINIVLKYKGIKRLEELRKNQRFCFCCSYHFSMRMTGSFVASKRENLELLGLVTRIGDDTKPKKIKLKMKYKMIEVNNK